MSGCLWPHGLQHARLPCSSLCPRVCSDSYALYQWCHPPISFFVAPFSSCPQFFPSIRIFSNKLALCIRWPMYWNGSFSISHSNEYLGLISFRIDWFDLVLLWSEGCNIMPPSKSNWNLTGNLMPRISSGQSLSRVWLFATPWTASCPVSLSSIISWILLKFMSVESVILSNHLTLCCPLLLLPSIFSKHQGLFPWVSSSHQVAKLLKLQLQYQSLQWIFRIDFL